MTLLGGLFSRKKKREASLASTEPPDSAQSSPTTASYVRVNPHPDSTRSSVSPPSSKLRLAFGRKKTASDIETQSHPPRASTDTNSVESRRLRPPPSRSAIFAAYGDPSGALSTRSLPTPNPPRRPSLFAWAKSSSPPSESSPPSSSTLVHDSPNNSDANSFNLKAFRHVNPPSPTNVSNSSLAPPKPRPRGLSTNSDASQRISVAAFREAQARRSTAGSPVPDFRSPSPIPSRSNTPEQARPRPSRSTPHIAQQRRRSSIAVTSNSDSDDSTSSSENDSEDDTIQPKSKAKSEIGHARPAPKIPPYRAPKSHLGHSPSPQQLSSAHQLKNKVPDVPSLGVHTARVRPRASVSASALSPTAAAKRASILVASNSKLGLSPPSPLMDTPRSPQLRPPSRASQAPTGPQSDSDSEDDAPLATLMGPRRPGSAMSSYSNIHSRSTGNVTTRSTTSHHKPLIDINELTRSAPPRSYTSPNSSGFTDGPTLLSQSPLLKPSRALSASPPPVSTPPWQTDGNDAEALTRKVPPVNFISPPASPAKDMLSSTPDIDSGGSPDDTKRDISPRRDPITDRLTRAVKKNLQPTSGGSSSPVVTGQNGSTSRELNPSSSDASDAPQVPTRKSIETLRAAQTRIRPPRSQMPFPSPSKSEHSPVDDELAQLLGTAVHFISRTGNTPPPQEVSESSESESCDEDEDDEDGYEKVEKETLERIAPIPIKQRSPPPSFSVTSRPPLARRENADSNSNSTTSPPRSEASSGSGLGGYTRPRSSTLVATSSSSSSFGVKTVESISASPGPSQHKSAVIMNFPNGNGGQTSTTDQRPSALKSSTIHVRQRSVTMVTGVPLSAQMPAVKKFTTPTTTVPDKPFSKPFTGGRRNSPPSSTGDSSSGRAPTTPRDGSDIGLPPRGDGNSKQQYQPQTKKHIKRRSVSFEDDMEDLKPPNRKHFIGASSSARGSSEGGDTSTEEDREVRRRERRRSEAKAAIELGNVINGKGPIVDDDDDMPINQTMHSRMSSLNPMMAMGNPMSMQMGFGGAPNLGPGGWGGQNMNMGMGGTPQMLSPAQFMVPPPADPNFLAAHQHAMLIAKQAYQMAVAQQAMAAAADEWERGSTVGGFGGGGGGGSVYGGSGVGPAAMMQPQFGMMGMMQGGGGGGGGWPASAASVYGASRSMYGGSQLGLPMDGMMSSSRSEYGGATNGRGGNNWSSSRSTYGESFGPAQEQYTRRGPQQQQQQQQQQGMRRTSNNNGRDSGYFPPVPPMPAAQGASGRNSPDSRQRMKPASPGRGGPVAQRKAAPPSSWKSAK